MTLTANDRLIVALDVDDAIEGGYLAERLRTQANVKFIKIGPRFILHRHGFFALDRLIRVGFYLFLDLKVYDTRDTVERTVRRAFDVGARFVTVHATPSVMEAAMRAKPDERCKVLGVPTLTDDPHGITSMKVRRFNEVRNICDGIICPPNFVASMKVGAYRSKLFVCPGIRPISGHQLLDNHVAAMTPTAALKAGADYLVVGRPIYRAPDPVAAARAILEEMERAVS